MRERRLSVVIVTLGSALCLSFAGTATASQNGPSKAPAASKAHPPIHASATQRPKATTRPAAAAQVVHRGTDPRSRTAHARTARSGGLSCVPYARAVTGMTVAGNAWQWWDNAAGTYARGSVPEAGSILAFRSNMRMPMGHVAVVSHVAGPRVVVIDHANWPVGGRRGAVSRGVSVVDVSERNDWSAVRVSLGGNGDYGSIYPTYGFIYNRPDPGMLRVASGRPAPHLALNAPPRDLRSRNDLSRLYPGDRAFEEVAQAPDVAAAVEQAIRPAPVRPLPAAPEFSFGN